MSSTVELEIKDWQRHRFGLTPDNWAALSGQSFWITGAGTGFGRAMSCALAAAGAKVILSGRRLEKLRETLAEMESLGISSHHCHTVRLDLADPQNILTCCQWVQSICPSLNGIVNNAALPSQPGSVSPLLNDSLETWQSTLAVNLTGPWLLTRTMMPHLLKSGRVRILFISSGAGWAATPGKGIYNISKAALNSLSHGLAQECARDFPQADLQINTLVAGEASTEMNTGSTNSPYAIAMMVLTLLAQPRGGPNGYFFTMNGSSLPFGQTKPYHESFKFAPPPAPSSKPSVNSIQRLIINQMINFDDGVQDRQVLKAMAEGLFSLKANIAFYGAGRLCRYFFKHQPSLSDQVKWVIEDHPDKLNQAISKVPIIPLQDLPESAELVFLCTTKMLAIKNMERRLRSFNNKLKFFNLSILAKLFPKVIPERAVQVQTSTIYPIEIPPIEFEPGLDLILLEIPPRYLPMMPNGLAMVHNILKTTGLRFQTADLNIIFLHRYNTRAICDGQTPEVWYEKSEGRPHPWENYNTDNWLKPGVLEHFRPDLDETIQALIKAHPKILAFSLNGNNKILVDEIIRGVKAKHPETIVLVGGYDCVNPVTAAFKAGDYDYMVIGEAELTLPPLIAKLAAGEKPSGLAGVVSRYDAPDRVFQPAPKIDDLDHYGFPKYEWLDVDLYSDQFGIIRVPFGSSRGCAWGRCNFCTEAFSYRKRNPARVVDEIEYFAQKGIRSFLSSESDINGDPENTLAVCREILRRNLKVTLSGQLRIDRRCDLEFFQTIQAAGFRQLTFGVDGWTDHVLQLQRKGYTMATVEQNLADCRAAGIPAAVNMVVGVPGETDEDVEETIRNLIKNKDRFLWLSTANMLRLAYDSRYYNDPERYHIRFRGDREQIYRENHFRIPDHLWYSVDPYIDHEVRLERYRHILDSIAKNGVKLGEYARITNTRLIEDQVRPDRAAEYTGSLDEPEPRVEAAG